MPTSTSVKVYPGDQDVAHSNGSAMDGYFVYLANKLDAIRLGGKPGKFDIVGELKTFDLWRAVVAELLATLLFVFIGTMSAVMLEPTSRTPVDFVHFNGSVSTMYIENASGDARFVKIAFAFGLMITVCIQMFGHISGGHMNPAVSIAMAVSMTISPVRAVFYVLAQCCGGMLGSLLLKGLTPSRLHSNLGLTSVHGDLTGLQGVVCETIFTFILVMSIYGCTDANRPMFGSPAVGIGLTIAVVHLAAIPFTGASMNPARSFASSVVSNSFDQHWVYWVGPILGGVVAALTYKFFFDPYRNVMSYEEATQQLTHSDDVLPIPKEMLKDIVKAPTGRENDKP